MRICFVYPGFGKRSWGTFGQSHWTSIIQAGLCGLSACCKQSGFEDVHLLDIRLLNDWNDFEAQFSRIAPDIVGLTMRSCDLKMNAEIARRIKLIKSSTRIVVGGVHVSIDPQWVQKNHDYDYVIAGEGEITFVELLKALQAKKEFPRFSWGERPDLDELPFIDRELYPYRTVVDLPNYEGIFKSPMVTMLCSRGCRYNCSFCAPHARTHFGQGLRFRAVDNVIRELEYLYDNYHFKCVKFYDYTFTQNPEWVREFVEKYRKFSKPFWIQSRADLVVKGKELIRSLAEVGLTMIGIGFESGSDKVLKFLRKGTTREINLQAARIVKNSNVLLSASFMLGVPEEEDDDVKATVSLAREMQPDFTSVAFFTPIPGNDLYSYCKDNDLIISDDPEMWVEFSPGIPKIKGKDYGYLKEAAADIMGIKFGGRYIGRLIRYVYVKTKYYYKLRRILVFLYSKYKKARKWMRQ